MDIDAAVILYEAEKEKAVGLAIYGPKPNTLEKAWLKYMDALVEASNAYLRVADREAVKESGG